MHFFDPWDEFGQRVEYMDGLEKTHFIDSIYRDWDRYKKFSDNKLEVIYRVFLTELIKDHGH